MAQPRAKEQGWRERESGQDPGVPYSRGAHAHTPDALSPLICAMCMLSPAKGQLKNSDLSKALTSSFVFYWDLKWRKANFQAKSRAWESSRPDPTYVSVFRSASASAASSTT